MSGLVLVPGAEAVAQDLREIADVESWARPSEPFGGIGG